MTMPTEQQRDRAQALGRMAGRAGQSVTVCPWPVEGAPADRVLAARFVAGYVQGGGTVDGMELGISARDDNPFIIRATEQQLDEVYPLDARDPKRAFGHLGY